MDTIKINFILTKDEDNNDIMKTNLDDKEYIIDFTSEDQTTMRVLFLAILRKLQTELIEFNYIKEDGYRNPILEQTAEEYIKELNNEISNIYNEIQSIFSR